MILTEIIPQSNNVQVTVPDNYIGKKLQIIVFAEEDETYNGNNSDTKPGNTSKFEGMLNLSEERYKDFQQHAKEIRNEWEREF